MSRLFDALKKLENNKEKENFVAKNLAIFKKQKQINLKVYLFFFLIISVGFILIFGAKVLLNKKHQERMVPDLRKQNNNILKNNIFQEKNSYYTQKENAKKEEKKNIVSLNKNILKLETEKNSDNLKKEGLKKDKKNAKNKYNNNKKASNNKKEKVPHYKINAKVAIKKETNNHEPAKEREIVKEKIINYSNLIIAEEERKRGNFKKAIEFYEKYLDENKEVDHKILNNLGALYLKAGNLEKAIFYLKMAYMKDSKDPKITKNLFIAYWKMGDKEKACEIIKNKSTLFDDWYQKLCH